jgi:hypothetical protein
MEINDVIKGRIKKIHLELIDANAELQKSAMKLNLESLLTGETPEDRTRIGLVRDISDHYIRIGSLMRRLCDIVEPFMEEPS